MAKLTGIITLQAFGTNGPGVISAPDVKAGDVLLRCGPVSGQGLDYTANFPTVVATDGEIHKLTPTDYSALEFVFVFLRQ